MTAFWRIAPIFLTGLWFAEGAFAVNLTEPVRAHLQPRHQTQLSAGLSAKIVKLPFREGEHFKKGDMLLTYDCRLEEAQLRYAKAEVKAAKKEAQSVEALNRLNGTSMVEVESARAKVELAQAKQQIEAVRVEACRETAPFSGTVTKVYVHAEQRVKPGDVIMDIEDPSVLEVEMRVPSSWLLRLKPGQAFQMHVDDTGSRIRGEIMRLGSQVDPVSRTVTVYGVVTSPSPAILSGMSGDVRFEF